MMQNMVIPPLISWANASTVSIMWYILELANVPNLINCRKMIFQLNSTNSFVGKKYIY